MGFSLAHIPAACLLETMNSIITQRQRIGIYLAIRIPNLFRVAQSAAMVTVTTKFQQSTWAYNVEILPALLHKAGVMVIQQNQFA